uniref:GPN-loop GTPase n=1 Tax=Scapholeberis mucronata TaxID=202097 RepID=A0A4Y7NM27_9CRUS|nr:EOG090X072H [Scapholeberis mucronata]
MELWEVLQVSPIYMIAVSYFMGNLLFVGSMKPVCLIVLGMAGSGKTSFVQQLTSKLHSTNKPPYVINLDPACREVPYPVNIDIRDTVNYKEVMKQYSLGPNGGIVTSLNLFATKFDQVIKLVEKRSTNTDLAIFDTPGQIEVFTWSASGTIISETLAALFPTVVVYVIDIVRSVSPVTFMSNMLYACSILYKLRLPFIVVMNKIDVVRHDYAVEWMRDFDAFEAALSNDSSYNANLSRSLSLTLDEFYKDLNAVGFSAVTGEGFDEFLAAVDAAVVEFETEYCPEYERLKKLQMEARVKHKAKQMKKFEEDVESEAVGGDSINPIFLNNSNLFSAEDERMASKSFHEFLEEQRKKQQSKSNNAPS